MTSNNPNVSRSVQQNARAYAKENGCNYTEALRVVRNQETTTLDAEKLGALVVGPPRRGKSLLPWSPVPLALLSAHQDRVLTSLNPQTENGQWVVAAGEPLFLSHTGSPEEFRSERTPIAVQPMGGYAAAPIQLRIGSTAAAPTSDPVGKPEQLNTGDAQSSEDAVTIDPAREAHILISGMVGTGKTVLLEELAHQFIEQGGGVVFIQGECSYQQAAFTLGAIAKGLSHRVTHAPVGRGTVRGAADLPPVLVCVDDLFRLIATGADRSEDDAPFFHTPAGIAMTGTNPERMLSPDSKARVEATEALVRIGCLGRSAGVHLAVTTQSATTLPVALRGNLAAQVEFLPSREAAGQQPWVSLRGNGDRSTFAGQVLARSTTSGEGRLVHMDLAGLHPDHSLAQAPAEHGNE